MSQFITYLQLGFDHISDLAGFDHILFILTLCAVYKPSEWKKVAILVTAFTVGHSVTLALCALKIIVLNGYLIELLIPITIFCTSLLNLTYPATEQNYGKIPFHYLLALIFGFIHGMGFSNFFNALMGDNGTVLPALLSFNIGLELGQLLIVTLFFCFYLAIQALMRFEHKNWIMFFSGAGAGVSLVLIMERI